MPLYEENRVEYAILSGHITIVADSGHRIPAYWAHPQLGQRFPGIALLHDWWGMTNMIRRLSNFFAQMGYYVIAPDLYQGERADTPKAAMQLLEKFQEARWEGVDAALTVLETHNRTNRSVATVGVGMGGTLSLRAAIERSDLEAAVAYGGFPQQLLGQFGRANTPILALYGAEEPYTRPAVIERLRDELAQTPLGDRHQVEVIDGAGHDFFPEEPTPQQRQAGKQVIHQTLDFLEAYLERPKRSGRSRTI